MAQSGFTPILLYASGTPTNVPSAGNLTSSAAGAELALNYADGKLFYKDSGGVVQTLATKGTGSIGGSTTQVQYNNAGALAGSANLTFDGTALTLGGNPTLSAGTANGVLYLNGSKVATSGSALTWDGTTLGISGGISASNNVIVTGGSIQARNGILIYSWNSDTTNFAYLQNVGSTGTGNAQLAFALQTAGEVMRLTSTGLGIGTSSPVAKLDVNGNQSFSSSAFIIGYGLNTQTATIAGATSPYYGLNMATFTGFSGQGIGLHGYYGLLFSTSGTERMRLDSSGNLGIGTSSPVGRLDSRGAAYLGTNSNNAFYVDSTASVVSIGAAGRTAFSTSALAFITSDGASATERMRLDSSGNLGLGVTPSAWATAGGQRALQVGSLTAVWQGANGGAGFGFNAYESGSNTYTYLTTNPASFYQHDGAHRWYTAPSGTAGNTISFTQAMTLFASGNLTIGGTNDSARLRVEGTTNLTTGLQLFRSGNACSALWTESGALRFGVDGSTGFTEWMQLNLSGNLGLGVTPSAWAASARTIDFAFPSVAMDTTGAAVLGFNAYNSSGTTWNYRSTDEAALFTITNAGAFTWRQAASGTAGNTISFTQAMTLDASGNLLVGGTTQLYGAAGRGLIQVSGSSQALLGFGTTGNVGLGFLYHTGTNFELTNAQNGYLSFGTNNTERARITSGGDLLVGTTAQPSGVSARQVVKYGTADYVSYFWNSNASPYGIYVQHDTDANGTGNNFLVCNGNATARAVIRSNGGFSNYQANDTNLSDRREKTNFAPAKDYLDTICAIPVQTFNYIDQSPDDPGLTLGVVAQDVQAVAPELVMESNWGTEDNPKMRLSVYQTDLQYALMKCIQEQQALITDLRARVAQLERQS